MIKRAASAKLVITRTEFVLIFKPYFVIRSCPIKRFCSILLRAEEDLGLAVTPSRNMPYIAYATTLHPYSYVGVVGWILQISLYLYCSVCEYLGLWGKDLS